jgi:hypothetical protein
MAKVKIKDMNAFDEDKAARRHRRHRPFDGHHRLRVNKKL